MTHSTCAFRAAFMLGACLAAVIAQPAFAAPTIHSLTVNPTPLVAGDPFTIEVVASPDVTQGTATIDLRPGLPKILRVPLAHIAGLWIGSGELPADAVLPSGFQATVKALLFDAARQRAEATVQVGVVAVSDDITAVFNATLGILTVTGDNANNVIVVGRDPSGALLVNDGAIPVQGGLPTVSNTTLIRMIGLDGDDKLSLDISQGPLPRTEMLGGEGDDELIGGQADDTLDGGPGNDTLFGLAGVDTLLGGPGDDVLVGGSGADPHFGGEGDDTFVWNPGDGSDTIEGQDGFDTLEFHGSVASETLTLTPEGARLRLFRNIASVLMDCGEIEQANLQVFGGSDLVIVNDLAGLDLQQLNIDLFALDGVSGDTQPDNIIVNATNGEDVVLVVGSGNDAIVYGLAAQLNITGAEAANDRLIVNLLDGDDVLDATGLEAGAIQLTGDGGPGADALLGGDGNDILLGGDGDDVLLGGLGLDILDGGPGDNIVIQ